MRILFWLFALSKFACDLRELVGRFEHLGVEVLNLAALGFDVGAEGFDLGGLLAGLGRQRFDRRGWSPSCRP